MADLNRLGLALKNADAAGDTQAAQMLANAIRKQRASTSGDTSMGTAFQVADAQAQSAAMSGMASYSRNLEDSFLTDAIKTGREYVANPVREFFGFDAIDTDAVNKAETKRLEAGANSAQKNAQKVSEDTDFKNLTTGDVDSVGSFANFVGQKTAQAVPYMGASLATMGTMTYPFTTGEVSQSINPIEGLTQEQKDNVAATGGLVMTALENLGIAKLLPNGASSSIIGAIAKGFVTEGTTETLQELVLIGSEKVAGKEFSEGEIFNRLKEAGAAGGVVGGSLRAPTAIGQKVTGAVKPTPTEVTEETRAASTFASRLKNIAQANKYNLKDIKANSTTGARETVDKAHIQITEDLKVKFKDLKDRVAVDKQTKVEDLADKILAQAAYREGKNKTKSTVGAQELAALDRLAGDTKEGQESRNLLLELNELTKVHNDGYKGGVSQYTDIFSPIGLDGNNYNPAAQVSNKLLTPAIATGAAFQTGGVSLGLQGAAVGTGRAIDAVTGRRSNVARYVKKNQGEGQVAPTAPSLRAQSQLQEQQAENAKLADEAGVSAANLSLLKDDAPPSGDISRPDSQSPQFIFQNDTGLDRNGIAKVLRILKRTNKDPVIQKAIVGYENSLATGERFPNAFLLLRAVKSHIKKKPGTVPPSSRTLALEAAQETAATPNSENYNRGIADNQALNSQLSDAAAADPKLDDDTRRLVLKALADLRLNLGDNLAARVNKVSEIAESASSQISGEAFTEHLAPYITRILDQQTRQLDKQEADSKPDFLRRQALAPQPRKFGATTDVSLDTSLVNSRLVAQEKVYPKNRDLKLDLQKISLDAQEREGIDLTQYTAENAQRLSDFAFEDALEALKDNANAIGWYGRTTEEALATVASLYPEVATDPAAKLRFVWILSATSNGLEVTDNMRLALKIYKVVRETGVMPKDMGTGKAAKTINKTLQKYHTMFDKMRAKVKTDEEASAMLTDFMLSQAPLKQLQKEYGVKIDGESANTLVRGASIIGPKIGNGFFSNLYGKFDALTMDRWLMRSVGRWRGNLVVINKPMIEKKTKEIKDVLKTADLKSLKPLFARSSLKPRKSMTKDEIQQFSNIIAKESMDPKWRDKINAIKGGDALRKKGNSLAQYLDGQVEMPLGPTDREFIRSVFGQTLDRLNSSPEIKQKSKEELTMSDLQALLWYTEKLLYDTSKQKDGESRGYEDSEAPDYANAARNIVQEIRQRGAESGEPGPTGALSRVETGSARGDGAPPGIPRPSIPFTGALRARPTAQSNGSNAAPGPGPTEAQVKQSIPRVSAAFEVGKRGGKYEKGIKNLSQVKALANTLGVGMTLYPSLEKMNQENPGLAPGTEAVYFDSSNTVVGLQTGALSNAGVPKTKFGAYISMLHEVSHSIVSRSFGEGSRTLNTRADNPLTGEPDFYAENSFENLILNTLKDNTPKNRKIVKELIYIQDNEQLVDTVTNQGEPVRTFAGNKKALDNYRRRFKRDFAGKYISGKKDLDARFDTMFETQITDLKDNENYIRSIAEITVDPMILYLNDPQRMKQVAPETAKLMSDTLALAGNKSIQLYNYPLAMALAVIMAGIAAAAGLDDEELPPGALSPRPGALTV